MANLHQIHESDLATLESTLPQLARAMAPQMDNRMRTQIRRIQRILTDVRWNYGPPSSVEVIRPGDDDETAQLL